MRTGRFSVCAFFSATEDIMAKKAKKAKKTAKKAAKKKTAKKK